MKSNICAQLLYCTSSALCSTRLLAETTPSVGFQNTIFVWREALKDPGAMSLMQHSIPHCQTYILTLPFDFVMYHRLSNLFDKT